MDAGLDAVLRVAPATGNRTVVSGANQGSGPDFIFPEALVVDSDGSLVVVDSGLGAVFRVNPGSGDRTVVSDARTGSGLSFVSPSGIAVESSGRIVVVDALLAAVVGVDPIRIKLRLIQIVRFLSVCFLCTI